MTTVCTYSPTTQSSYMDHSFSRHANSAGLALPHIPRRAASHSRVSSYPTPVAQTITPTKSARVVVQPPTPTDVHRSQSVASASGPSTSSGTGSGSDLSVQIASSKPRRPRMHQRGAIPLMCPPEQSTPTPAAFKAKATKNSIVPFPSQDLDSTPRASSSIFAPTPRTPADWSPQPEGLPSRATSVTIAALGRKKSGEPLKSSLKSRRPIVRGDLSVITGPVSSKSEPSTPTHIKSVHFDSKLEHVKLFLAEQKPLAVSRDGSPTDDTSGTESDFPTFIYGDSKDEKKGKLTMVTQGVRPESVEDMEKADVKVESLELSEDGTSISGRIRVRNLAFEKWVAVRFTFDWWQTTSEVTARYLESFPGGDHDRFQFSIRLNDMLGRIEEKTLFLAIRYTAAGKEIWDNNNGANYRVSFAREKIQPPRPVAAMSGMDEAGKGAGIARLKSKLEKVVSDEEGRTTVGSFLSTRTTRARSLSPTGPSSGTASRSAKDSDSFTLKSSTPLSSRYDFSASLKGSWGRSPNEVTPTPAGDRSRTNTYPNALPHFPRHTDKRTFIALTRGSPRIFDSDDAGAQLSSRSYYAASELDDTPVPAVSRKSSRNHQRGYFDLGVSPSANGVRRTPPGSPFGRASPSPSSSGRNSPSEIGTNVPAISTTDEYGLVGMWRVSSGGSDDSTPSSASNDDSSRSSSPDGSPFEGPVSLAPDNYPRSPSPGDEHNYSAFINRYVVFTRVIGWLAHFTSGSASTPARTPC